MSKSTQGDSISVVQFKSCENHIDWMNSDQLKIFESVWPWGKIILIPCKIIFMNYWMNKGKWKVIYHTNIWMMGWMEEQYTLVYHVVQMFPLVHIGNQYNMLSTNFMKNTCTSLRKSENEKSWEFYSIKDRLVIHWNEH